MSALDLAPVQRTPVGASLERLRSLVSPLTGIVGATGELMRMTDDARLVKIGAFVADQRALVGTKLDNRPGGTSNDRSAALAASIGESAERYAASYLPRDRVQSGRARDLADAVDPARFALFSGEQYEQPGFLFVPFTDAVPIGWVDGAALPGGRPALLPAQLVFMSFETADLLHEPRIGYTTSNGLACGATREETIVAALSELLERDAFLIAWEDRLSLPLLDWSDSPELTRYAARYFDPSGLDYAAVDLSAFWDVPTVLGVVRNRGEGASLGVGAACGATVEAAWRSALGEAFSVRSWARSELYEGPARSFDADFANVAAFADHVAFHGEQDNHGAAAFLDAALERRSTAHVPPLPTENVLATLEALCERLAARGMTAYAVDVTTVDLRQAGLHVFKAVVPELCALSALHTARFCGGRRLYHAAHELGLVEAPLTFDDLNPFPHPFP